MEKRVRRYSLEKEGDSLVVRFTSSITIPQDEWIDLWFHTSWWFDEHYAYILVSPDHGFFDEGTFDLFPAEQEMEEESKEEKHEESLEPLAPNEYLAQMGDHSSDLPAEIENLPCHSSEIHVGLCSPGEQLVGGSRRRGRKKQPMNRRKGQGYVRQGTYMREVDKRIVSVGHIASEAVITDLTWFYVGTLSGASSTLNAVYHTNDPYDVDPAIGGTSAAGFNEWSNLYDNFRVLSYMINLEFVNLETVPINIYLVDSTQSVTSGSALQGYSAGPGGRSYVLGPKGSTQGIRRITYSKRITDVIGSKAPLYADNFMGTTSGSLAVADHTFISLGLQSLAGTNLTTGVSINWRITFRTKMYSRKVVA